MTLMQFLATLGRLIAQAPPAAFNRPLQFGTYTVIVVKRDAVEVP